MKYIIELNTSERDIICSLIRAIRDNILGEDRLFEDTKLFKFDENSTDYDAVYRKGIEDGKEWAIEENDENRQGYYDNGYNNALKDLTHAMKVYFPLNSEERLKHFGINIATDNFAVNNPRRLIAEAKTYEEKKKAEEEIKVGDIVRFNEKCHNYNAVKDREYLVLHVFENELVTLLYDNGDTGAADISLLNKTNRHIEEVSQLLDKLRGKK